MNHSRERKKNAKPPASKDRMLHQPGTPRISEKMPERHIRQYIEAQTGDEWRSPGRVASQPCSAAETPNAIGEKVNS
jgi:hypothetical protein